MLDPQSLGFLFRERIALVILRGGFVKHDCAMENENLREWLEKLYLSLLGLSTSDEVLSSKRDALAAHIREALDRQTAGDSDLALRERLTEEFFDFEESHPELSQLVINIKNMLASVGI